MIAAEDMAAEEQSADAHQRIAAGEAKALRKTEQIHPDQTDQHREPDMQAVFLPEQQEMLEVASILHDIGIRPAEQKYGNCNGKLQEQEGPAYARKLLQEAGSYSQELIDRVCFLIAHHHTYKDVDGLDWQILLEADFLVNSFEKSLPEKAIKKFRSAVFKTKSGTALLNNQYGYEE